MARPLGPRTWSIYLHTGNISKTKPKKVGTVTWDAIPSTYEHEGRPYFFHLADLADSYVVFSDVRPTAKEVSA